MEALAAKTAVDVEGFYAARAPSVVAGSDVVVLSVEGKGIVMRPESLRAATAKAAEGAAPKLGTRLSKGEKRYRKRMAEIGAVYDLTPAVRTPEQVMARSADKDPIPKPPVAANKWVTASVVDDAAAVIAEVFDQAARRDPDHSRTWVALVDGNNHQINRIEAEATSRKITVHVVIDLIHVLEYLWGAAWCFYNESTSRSTLLLARQLAVMVLPTPLAPSIRTAVCPRKACPSSLSTTLGMYSDALAIPVRCIQFGDQQHVHPVMRNPSVRPLAMDLPG